ncbi:MAG: hypothetical protein QXQ50_09295 [Candidatus Bathyarchaeia archaeon]
MPSIFKLKISYKKYFTFLMFLTEALAIFGIWLMWIAKTNLTQLITCGFLTLIFTVITMALHIIVRLEQLLNK